MSTQAQFLKQFANHSNFELVGQSLLMRTDTLTVKVELSTSGTHKTWTGLKMTIIGRMNQQVLDTHTFKFDDFLSKKQDSRKHDYFCVIEHCGWDWYIMYPTEESIGDMMGTMEYHASMFE